MERQKVLFLCTGNSARSQMAEAFLRKYAGVRYAVYSAGLEPKVLNPYTIQVMEEIGIGMGGHSSKELGAFIGKVEFDYLITVCGGANERCPSFPGMGTRLHWDLEDPAAFEGDPEEKLAKFRQVRDQIQARVSAWLKEEQPV